MMPQTERMLTGMGTTDSVDQFAMQRAQRSQQTDYQNKVTQQMNEAKQKISELDQQIKQFAKEKVNFYTDYYNRVAQKQMESQSFWKDIEAREKNINSHPEYIKGVRQWDSRPARAELEKMKEDFNQRQSAVSSALAKEKAAFDGKEVVLKTELSKQATRYYEFAEGGATEAQNFVNNYIKDIDSVTGSEISNVQAQADQRVSAQMQSVLSKYRADNVASGVKPKDYDTWTSQAQKNWIEGGVKPRAESVTYTKSGGKTIETKNYLFGYAKDDTGKAVKVSPKAEQMYLSSDKQDIATATKYFQSVGGVPKQLIESKNVQNLAYGSNVEKAEAKQYFQQQYGEVPQINKSGGVVTDVIFPSQYVTTTPILTYEIKDGQKVTAVSTTDIKIKDVAGKLDIPIGNVYKDVSAKAEVGELLPINEEDISYYGKQGYEFGPIDAEGNHYIIAKGGEDIVKSEIVGVKVVSQGGIISPTISERVTPYLPASVKNFGTNLLKISPITKPLVEFFGQIPTGIKYEKMSPLIKPEGGEFLGFKLSPFGAGIGLKFAPVTAEGTQKYKLAVLRGEMTPEKARVIKEATSGAPALISTPSSLFSTDQFLGLGTTFSTATRSLAYGNLYSPLSSMKETEVRRASEAYDIAKTEGMGSFGGFKVNLGLPTWGKPSLSGSGGVNVEWTKATGGAKWSRNIGLEGGLVTAITLAPMIKIPATGVGGKVVTTYGGRIVEKTIPNSIPYFKGLTFGEASGKVIGTGFKGLMGLQAVQTVKNPTAENVIGLGFMGVAMLGMKYLPYMKEKVKAQSEYIKGKNLENIKRQKNIYLDMQQAKLDFINVKKLPNKVTKTPALSQSFIDYMIKSKGPEGNVQKIVLDVKGTTFVYKGGKRYRVSTKITDIFAENVMNTRAKKMISMGKKVIIEPPSGSYISTKKMVKFLKEKGYTEGEISQVIGNRVKPTSPAETRYQSGAKGVATIREDLSQFLSNVPETKGEYYALKKQVNRIKQVSGRGFISFDTAKKLGIPLILESRARIPRDLNVGNTLYISNKKIGTIEAGEFGLELVRTPKKLSLTGGVSKATGEYAPKKELSIIEQQKILDKGVETYGGTEGRLVLKNGKWQYVETKTPVGNIMDINLKNDMYNVFRPSKSAQVGKIGAKLKGGGKLTSDSILFKLEKPFKYLGKDYTTGGVTEAKSGRNVVHGKAYVRIEDPTISLFRKMDYFSNKKVYEIPQTLGVKKTFIDYKASYNPKGGGMSGTTRLDLFKSLNMNLGAKPAPIVSYKQPKSISHSTSDFQRIYNIEKSRNVKYDYDYSNVYPNTPQMQIHQVQTRIQPITLPTPIPTYPKTQIMTKPMITSQYMTGYKALYNPMMQTKSKSIINTQIKPLIQTKTNIQTQTQVKTQFQTQLQSQSQSILQIPLMQNMILPQVQTQTQVQTQVQVQTQKQIQTQPPVSPEFTVDPIVPIVPTPIIINYPFTTDKDSNKKKKIKYGKSYKVGIKRYGKWQTISMNLPKAEAIRLGGKVAKTTLGATFKIEPMKGFAKATKLTEKEAIAGLKGFRPYQIKQGKRIELKDTWIQEQPLRIKTYGEKSEARGVKYVKNPNKTRGLKWF